MDNSIEPNVIESMVEKERTSPEAVKGIIIVKRGSTHAGVVILSFLIILFGIIYTLVEHADSSMLYDLETPPIDDTVSNSFPKDLVIPTEYYITLLPYLTEPHFHLEGFVLIVVYATESTNRILLQATDLQLKKILVYRFCGNDAMEAIETDDLIAIKEIKRLDEENVQITLHESLIPEEFYKISIDFVGHLNDAMEGLFRHSYFDRTNNNKQVWYMGTQFYPSHARKAFPCFDRPNMKATFLFRINIPLELTAYSNLNQVSEDSKNQIVNIENRIWVYFKSDQNITTQSIVFAFLNASHSELPISDRLWECATTTAASMNRNFGADVTTKKILLMHNTSTVLLNGYDLLTISSAQQYDTPKISQINSRIGCSYVVYLFGMNYITRLNTSFKESSDTPTPSAYELMKFASDVGFGYDAMQDDFPLSYESIIANDIPKVMLAEGLINSIDRDANRYKNQLPKELLYYKEIGILLMFNSSLDYALDMDKILNRILYQKQYKFYEPNQFYDEYRRLITNEQTLTEFNAFLSIWKDENFGFPVIDVIKKKDGEFVISQERFTYEINERANHLRKWKRNTWKIPISYKGVRNGNTTENIEMFWLNTLKHSINDEQTKYDWILLNPYRHGYYRVNYDLETWQKIIKHYCSKSEHYHTLSVSTRIQLFDDVFNLARAGYISYDLPFGLSDCLIFEESVDVWRTAWNLIEYTLRLYDNHLLDYRAAKHKFRMQLPTLHEINIMSVACVFEKLECIKIVNQYLSHWKRNIQLLKTDINFEGQSAIFCHGAKTDEQFFDTLMAAYLNETTAKYTKYILLNAMTCAMDKRPLQLLDMAFSNVLRIRKMDIPNVIRGLSKTFVGRNVALDYLVANGDSILKNGFSENEYFSYMALVIETLSNMKSMDIAKIWITRYDFKSYEDKNIIEKALQISQLNLKAKVRLPQTHYFLE